MKSLKFKFPRGRSNLIYFLILFILFFAATSQAALNLELTQGINAAIPITIIPFSGQTDWQSPTNIAAIVTEDLQNSGRFNVKKNDDPNHQPHQARQVNFSFWQKQKINNLVVGQIIHLSSGQYQIHCQVLNVFNNKNASNQSGPAWQSAVLLNQTFTVNQNQLRRLGHHISDLIYQSLTGNRGVFSTRIAYVLVQKQNGRPYKYLLEVSDIDGYDPRSLLISHQPIMSPAWSPNGKQIAYVSFEGGHAAIYLQDVATGQRRIVTDYPGVNGAPAFSPDGKNLAVVLTKTGYPKIYLVNIANNKSTQLTHGWAMDTEPHFTHDGQSLIFTSNRGGGPQIYEMNLVSKHIKRLTYTGNYNARASITPNGQDLIMLHRSDGMYNIAMQNLTNGQLDVLTQNGYDQSPSVAPNGQMIVYATKYGGRGILAMVSTDDKVKLRLPARGGDVREPAWSPFLGG